MNIRSKKLKVVPELISAVVNGVVRGGIAQVVVPVNRTKQFAPQTAKLYRSAFMLRQKMLIAIQNFENA